MATRPPTCRSVPTCSRGSSTSPHFGGPAVRRRCRRRRRASLGGRGRRWSRHPGQSHGERAQHLLRATIFRVGIDHPRNLERAARPPWWPSWLQLADQRGRVADEAPARDAAPSAPHLRVGPARQRTEPAGGTQPPSSTDGSRQEAPGRPRRFGDEPQARGAAGAGGHAASGWRRASGPPPHAAAGSWPRARARARARRSLGPGPARTAWGRAARTQAGDGRGQAGWATSSSASPGGRGRGRGPEEPCPSGSCAPPTPGRPGSAGRSSAAPWRCSSRSSPARWGWSCRGRR